MTEILDVAKPLLKEGSFESFETLERLLCRAESFVRPLSKENASARNKWVKLLLVWIKMPSSVFGRQPLDKSDLLQALLREITDNQMESLLS